MMYKLTNALSDMRNHLGIKEIREVDLNLEHSMPYIRFKSDNKIYIINVIELPDV